MKKLSYTSLMLTTMMLGFVTQAVNAELSISQDGKNAATSTGASPVPNTAQMAANKARNATSTHYTLDPNHANVRFAIDHFGTTTNQGGFYGVTGDLTFDPAKKTGAIDVMIPINSLQTGNEHFTNHLKSKDFFNAAQYPTAEFKSNRFYFNGNKLSKVTGELTLLGQTHPVTLTANKFNCYASPTLNTQVCGGDFETTIDRTQWGMDGMVKMGISKNVKLTIQVEAGKN